MRNITLFIMGPANSGKTVAWSNVFHQMTSRGGVSAEIDGEEHSYMLVGKRGWDAKFFNDVFLDMVKGQPLPKGSAENRSYEMAFLDQGKSIANVLYMDYSGSLTQREYDEGYEEQLEEFDFMLKNTGLLIFIITGDTLQKYIDFESVEKGSQESETLAGEIDDEINHIRTLLLKAESLETTAPILYYVTKSDRIDDEEQIIPALERLIKNWKLHPQDKQVLGCHSTIGRGCHIVESIDDNGAAIRYIESGFKPYGFEIPMLLTIGFCLSTEGKKWAENRYLQLEQELDDATNQRSNQQRKKDGIRGKIANFFGRGKSTQAELEQTQRRIDELKEAQKNIDKDNLDRIHSQRILNYLKAKHSQDVLYLDRNGENRDLKYFFE